MNTLLLHPTDILFFRDGRPMSGSLAGHGAAWPLPSVTNAAFHAALHRAAIEDVHAHRRGRSSQRMDSAERDRKFGSLTTAGPFPVCPAGNWYFPRPLDAGNLTDFSSTFLPLQKDFDRAASSLPQPLKYPVANTRHPSKDILKPWWNTTAWCGYLESGNPEIPDFKSDSDFADTEHSIGIGIDSATGSQNGEQFYSAHYLRLRDGWKIGLFAEAIDKIDNSHTTRDLIPALVSSEKQVIIGGQQRLCTVLCETSATLAMPLGKSTGFLESGGKFLVKWTLLTPAIYPKINAHTGGWLPSWIDPVSGAVQLLDGPGKNAAKRRKIPEGKQIPATLVAAMTGKPIPVTGYALDNGLEDRPSGPKSTHLAVPAGSVYYFECTSKDAAEDLATALNWHGTSPGTHIHNRRSTLMGEKGFGLGACSAWSFHPGDLPGHP